MIVTQLLGVVHRIIFVWAQNGLLLLKAFDFFTIVADDQSDA